MPRPRTVISAALALSAALLLPGTAPAAATDAGLPTASPSATPTGPQTGSPSPEATAVELVQRARTAAGRPRLAWAGDLAAVAERHAGRMAAQRRIFHNPNVSREICCWRAYGENVGTSMDVSRLHNAFMNSTGHRGNILDARWREVGIGVVKGGDGRVYEVQVFRQRR